MYRSIISEIIMCSYMYICISLQECFSIYLQPFVLKEEYHKNTFQVMNILFFVIIKIYTVSWVKQANSNQ